jgi:HEPN domain-containing protein
MPAKRKAEARRWLQQALYDLKAARWNIQGGFHDTACFLAQQAGEKALKSLLYYVGSKRSALLTHSLIEMIEAAKKQVNALAGLLDEARQLDLHISPLVIRTVFPAGTHTGSTANQWRSKPWLQPNGSSQSSGTITRLKVMGRSWHRKTRLLNEH